MPEAFSTNTDTAVKPTFNQNPRGGDVRLDNDIEVPLSQYKSVNEISYTENFFKTSDPATEIIEQYIKSQIESRELNDTIGVYESIIKDLCKSLGIDKNETIDSKFNKLVHYIKLLNRSKTPKEMKEMLLQRAKDEKLRIQELKENI